MVDSTCNICIGENPIHPCDCNYDICKSCFERVILESNEIQIRCVNCKKDIPLDVVLSIFGKEWAFTKKPLKNRKITKFEKHMRDLLFKREMALMPSTVSDIENFKKNLPDAAEAIRLNNNIIDIYRRINEQYIVENGNNADINNLKNQLKSLKKTKSNRRKRKYLKDEIKKQSGVFNHFIYSSPSNLDMRREIHETVNVLNKLLNKNKKDNNVGYTYLCHCPRSKIEGMCRGLINSTTLRCTLCNSSVCGECLESADENHVCVQVHTENVKLIKLDCKPCPKCATTIYKDGGCDHMNCKQCMTHFSWRTGLIYYTEGGITYEEYRLDIDYINNALSGLYTPISIRDQNTRMLLTPLPYLTGVIDALQNSSHGYDIGLSHETNTYAYYRYMYTLGHIGPKKFRKNMFRLYYQDTVISIMSDIIKQLIHKCRVLVESYRNKMTYEPLSGKEVCNIMSETLKNTKSYYYDANEQFKDRLSNFGLVELPIFDIGRGFLAKHALIGCKFPVSEPSYNRKMHPLPLLLEKIEQKD